MAHGVCPWWLGYWMVSPIRRLREDPRRALAPFVGKGMTVLEPGPGMGFFTLDAARLVGPTGRVVAVDVQSRMLAGLERRARRAGLADRIELRLAQTASMGIPDLSGAVDVALAFHVVHELPAPDRFFAEVATALRPGGVVLFAEPKGHVSGDAFARSVAAAQRAGLVASGPLSGLWGRTARLAKR